MHPDIGGCTGCMHDRRHVHEGTGARFAVARAVRGDSSPRPWRNA